MEIQLNDNLVREVTRLKKIEFTNFRNIGHGSISFPNVEVNELIDRQPSILGLYGQNGSGKTSVVIALGILKKLLSGQRLDESYTSCIRRGFDRCTLEFTLVTCSFRRNENQDAFVERLELHYSVDITNKPDYRIITKSTKLPELKLFVENEILEVRSFSEDGKVLFPRQKLVDTRHEVSNAKGYAFGNATKYSLYAGDAEDTRKKLLLAKARCYISNKSFVFSNGLLNVVFGENISSTFEQALALIGKITSLFAQFGYEPDNGINAMVTALEIFQSKADKDFHNDTTKILKALDDDQSTEEDQLPELMNAFTRLVAEADDILCRYDHSRRRSIIARQYTEDENDDLYDQVIEELLKRLEALGKLTSSSILGVLLAKLVIYGESCLHIIDTTITGQTNMNNALPLLIWDYATEGDSIRIHSECISLSMDDKTGLPVEGFTTIEQSISAINIVLSELIPGIRLEVDDAGIVDEEAGKKHYFEIMSVRNDSRIPLKYESDGVRRIISLASMFIAVYNEPSFTMVIDEIDSGIFEYLLGELLQILSESAQGQFIFTSHNLRPLEVLPAKYLCFTSVNPERRFVKLRNRGNCNLRDTYFRTIILGADTDAIYNSTDRYRIQRAFRKAGHVGEPK